MVSADADRRCRDDRTGWSTQPFSHLVRIVELPPMVAQAAFDASRQARRCPGRPGMWEVEAAEGRLELIGDGRPRSALPRRYWPYRAVGGRIRAHWWQPPVPVLVELMPWSKTRCALGLSLRRRPLFAGEGLYLDGGAGTLEALGAEIEAWGLLDTREIERWLDDLSRENPSP